MRGAASASSEPRRCWDDLTTTLAELRATIWLLRQLDERLRVEEMPGENDAWTLPAAQLTDVRQSCRRVEHDALDALQTLSAQRAAAAATNVLRIRELELSAASR